MRYRHVAIILIEPIVTYFMNDKLHLKHEHQFY